MVAIAVGVYGLKLASGSLVASSLSRSVSCARARAAAVRPATRRETKAARRMRADTTSVGVARPASSGSRSRVATAPARGGIRVGGGRVDEPLLLEDADSVHAVALGAP